MKKIVALSCVLACLTAMAGVPQMNSASVTGNRFCLLHVYEWTESANGNVQVSTGDPFYQGGWTVTLAAGESGTVIVEGGITPFGLNQPMLVNASSGTVTLEVGDEPFATETGQRIESNDYTTTTVDSTVYYYVVNEDWLVNGGALANVTGEVLSDGSIHIADGFAIYVETVKTTTVKSKGVIVNEFTDETHTTSPIYRDTWLMMPNGKHEFVCQSDGLTCSVDVFIRQEGDQVYVTNLYGYGAPECYMVLNDDGTMTYPGQPLRDIEDTMSPGGAGFWYNSNGNALGNEGNATTQAITWGLTIPTDNVQTWDGWTNNVLHYTNGSHFVVPTGGLRGDVDGNGSVTIDDVTALIDYLLGGDSSLVNLANADCNLDGGVTIDDVTELIDYLLGGEWHN